MFEKILSLLPYNPSLLHQLSFYSRRMREEAAIRRTGTIFIVLAFCVQFFAVVSPPAASASYSNNDMIVGGVLPNSDAKAQAAVVAYCRNQPDRNYQDVLAAFGISCADLAGASVVNINSAACLNANDGKDNGKSYANCSSGNRLYSMGWISQGQTNQTTGRDTDQHRYNLPKVPYFIYGRLLHSFDSASGGQGYRALKFKVGGQVYYILFDCGNLVAIGPPVPVPPKTPPKTPAPTCTDKTSFATNPTCFCKYHASNSQCKVPPSCTSSTSFAKNPICYCKYHATNSRCTIPPPKQPTCPTLPGIDNPCATPHKTAANLTENISNADGTTAQPGDLIRYTLSVTDTGKAPLLNFVFTEDLSDVMDYATPTDLGDGHIDSNDEVVWPAVNIQPNTTATEQITVKVKNPLPQTPVDPGDPNHFDLIMTNTFGDTINIKVPCSGVRCGETVVNTLPNTGPGTGLFIAAILMVAAGYFYSRSRLLATEASLALHDTANGGF